MVKIIKKIKKVSREIKNVSARARKVLGKVVTKRTRTPSRKAPQTVSFPGMEAQQTKYFTSSEPGIRLPKRKVAVPEVVPPALGPQAQRVDLPEKYDKDIIVLQVRDPWWLHTYWEVRDATYQKLKSELGSIFDSAKKALRVYDVSYIDFNGLNAHRFFNIELTHDANNWYIDTGGSGRSWCVDFGLKLPDDRFITIVRSNIVSTPLEGPSWIADEEWTVPEELFARLYASAVGLGSSPVRLKKPWSELGGRQLFSGGISSVGFSPVKKEGKRKFWLVVNTELIVYGATEPDAKVTVGGKPISLRPNGTFSLRFSLPDGKQVIPVKARSCDYLDERTITPVVIKETH
jgi:hypothetical protein